MIDFGYDMRLTNLCKWKKSFVVTSSGSWKHVEINGWQQKEKYFKGNFIPGIHLVNLVRKECATYKGKNYPPRHRIPTVFYSPDNIRNINDRVLVAIDIDNCYWQTIFNCGIISDSLYEKGMIGGAKWKQARNIAVGSTGKYIVTEKYVDGIRVSRITDRDPLYKIRYEVVDHVCNVASSIIGQAKEGFLMFLTDCFFIDELYADMVQHLLYKAGYESKVDCIRNFTIESFRKSSDKVTWEKLDSSTNTWVEKSQLFNHSNDITAYDGIKRIKKASAP